jgi:alkylhydroperoxidase family enzyme
MSRLNIIRTLAHHPDLAIPYLNFGMRILRFSSLPPRLRVIATLRTAWLYHCGYEWKEHVSHAPRAGITEEEVEAAKVGSSDPLWTDLERTVLRAVEQLRDETTIDDETWAALSAEFDQRQLLDFLFTVGNYAMLAMVVNSARVELEA